MTKRRSRGEGTIYQRPDGLWAAQVTLPSGKRKTKCGKSQKLVRDWLHEQQNSVRQGAWTDGVSLTVKDFLGRYQSDIVTHTLRPKTQETYNIIISNHQTPLEINFGGHPMRVAEGSAEIVQSTTDFHDPI